MTIKLAEEMIKSPDLKATYPIARSVIIATVLANPFNPSIRLYEFVRPVIAKQVNKIDTDGVANNVPKTGS